MSNIANECTSEQTNSPDQRNSISDIHADEDVDPANQEDLPAERLAEVHQFGQHGGVNMSIEVSDTFVFKNPENMSRAFVGELGPDAGVYIYSRNFNPTVKNLSSQLAKMEGTETAYCTSSGMSAIVAVLLQLCQNGGHVVAANTLYGGTYALLKHFLPEKCNITTTFVDITKTDVVDNAIVKGKTSVLYFESISNPTLVVADIRQLSDIAKKKSDEHHKVYVVVDNTFAPMILSPSKFGADLVVHSLTKYVCGGSDTIAGAICGPSCIVDKMMDLTRGPLMVMGPTVNPKEAFELSVRLSHLSLRMKKHCSRAKKLAQRMKDELRLEVIYPGLENHLQHDLLDSMRNKGYGFGGVLCVDMKTTKKANSLMKNLQEDHFGFLAVSLGYYETLMSCSGSSTSSEMSEAEKKKASISPGLVRFSIGYVGTLRQKWNLFKQAYAKV